MGKDFGVIWNINDTFYLNASYCVPAKNAQLVKALAVIFNGTLQPSENKVCQNEWWADQDEGFKVCWCLETRDGGVFDSDHSYMLVVQTSDLRLGLTWHFIFVHHLLSVGD